MKKEFGWQSVKDAWNEIKWTLGREVGRAIARKTLRDKDNKWVRGSYYIFRKLDTPSLDPQWRVWFTTATASAICHKAREGNPPFTPFLAGVATGICGPRNNGP